MTFHFELLFKRAASVFLKQANFEQKLFDSSYVWLLIHFSSLLSLCFMCDARLTWPPLIP